VGHRDVPGKPAMFGTTKEFLDYFGLKKLDDLPPLSELKDFDKLNIQLDFPGGDMAPDEVQADGAEQIDDVDADAQLDNVSSLDDARAAAQDDDDVPEDPVEEPVVDEQEPATVIPLKQP
jgi:segregation and condensation protein B